jgi:hypothetical protein
MKNTLTTLLLLSYLTVSAQLKKIYFNYHSDTTVFNGKTYQTNDFDIDKTVIINSTTYNYGYLYLYKRNKDNKIDNNFEGHRCESTDTTLFYFIQKNNLINTNDKKIQKLKFNDGNPQLIEELTFLNKKYGIARSNYRLYKYDGSDTLKLISKIINYTLPFKGEYNKLVYYDSVLNLFNENLSNIINREKFIETGYYVPRESVQDFLAYIKCNNIDNSCLDPRFVRYTTPTFSQEYLFYYDKVELNYYTSNVIPEQPNDLNTHYLKEISKTPDSLVMDNIIITDLLIKTHNQSKINLNTKLLVNPMFLLNDSLLITGHRYNNEYQLGIFNINNSGFVPFTSPKCKFITHTMPDYGLSSSKTEYNNLTPNINSFHLLENENKILCSDNAGNIFYINLNNFNIETTKPYVIEEYLYPRKNEKRKQTELVYLRENANGTYTEIPWLNYTDDNFLVERYYRNDNR